MVTMVTDDRVRTDLDSLVVGYGPVFRAFFFELFLFPLACFEFEMRNALKSIGDSMTTQWQKPKSGIHDVAEKGKKQNR